MIRTKSQSYSKNKIKSGNFRSIIIITQKAKLVIN